MHLATLVTASLLAMELIVRLATAADARAAGLAAPAATTIAAGIVVATLYTLGSLVVLARPLAAALLFVLAAALGFSAGREDGSEELQLTGYGVLALLLAAVSIAGSRLPPHRRKRLHVRGRRPEAAPRSGPQRHAPARRTVALRGMAIE